MGRSTAKVPLELIKNERSRNVTFRKRKKGLLKKTYELNKLCDVQCFVIIFENKNGLMIRPETYPENHEELKQIIGRYVSKSAKVRKVENLTDFFEKQIMQVKKETAKLRQMNNEARYPSCDDKLDELPSNELLELLQKLEHKIEDVHRHVENQNATEENILGQMDLFPNNSADYSQMVALNQYRASGSMMYGDRAWHGEQANLQALFQNNSMKYDLNYNYGSSMMNMNIKCLPWQNYSIQNVPSTSYVPNYDEQNAIMKIGNLMQYGNIDDSLTISNHVLSQAVAYPMSYNYLFNNADHFTHFKG